VLRTLSALVKVLDALWDEVDVLEDEAVKVDVRLRLLVADVVQDASIEERRTSKLKIGKSENFQFNFNIIVCRGLREEHS
jgi:hypothetical protein